MARSILTVGALLLAAYAAAPADSPSESVKITFQGRERRYLLHATASRARPAPVVLVFHGGSETPEHMEEISGFSAAADRNGFVAAYPEAVERAWADGRNSTHAEAMGIDDVGFARAVVADISRRFEVDRRRIYATGPSNGGIFTIRVGCEGADLVAAIGPVIAAIAEPLAARCRPSAPTAVVGIQSVADPMVPFEGGEVGEHNRFARGGRVESSRATQELWRTIDGCRPEPALVPLPSRANDGTSVTRRTYSGCRAGTDVEWYEIAGGGHRWPPRVAGQALVERLARRELGVSSQNIDATEILWGFFSRHAKQ
jgi:polyhydroxybutyrate depolymerase